MFYTSECLAVLADGKHLHATARTLGFEVDYRLLLQTFQKKGRLLRAHYYTSLPENDAAYSRLRPVIDFIEYNGWTVETTHEANTGDDRDRSRAWIATALAMGAVTLSRQADHIVLFVGSQEFTPLTRFLQRQGVRVSVASSLRTNQPLVADSLRRQADNFIDLADLRDAIARPERLNHSA